MRIGTIVKGLIAEGIIVFPVAVFAWTVSERVIELPQETPTVIKPAKSAVVLDLPHHDRSRTNALPSPLAKVIEEPIFEKTQPKLTDDEEIMVDYRRAMEHISHGETVLAQKFLMGILNQAPNHHLARTELATLYIKQNQLELAEETLLEGLRIAENNADFLRLMAMVHDKRQEPEKALSLLVKVKDSRKQDKNYVAFLGHIYQETGHFALARQQYYRLLQEEPSNPLWLLGVSIALDSEGQRDAALEGYQRLQQEGKVDPSVLEYINVRIKALKG